jgi:hypothetical protein
MRKDVATKKETRAEMRPGRALEQVNTALVPLIILFGSGLHHSKDPFDRETPITSSILTIPVSSGL